MQHELVVVVQPVALDPDVGGSVERAVLFEPVHHLLQRHPVLGPQLDSEALVQFGDDAGQNLDFVVGAALVDPS